MSYHAETLVFFYHFHRPTASLDTDNVETIFMKPMSFYSISMVPVPGNMDTYLGYSHEYMQVHVQ